MSMWDEKYSKTVGKIWCKIKYAWFRCKMKNTPDVQVKFDRIIVRHKTKK